MLHLNDVTNNYDNVIYFYNGPNLGYEGEDEIIQWMIDNGFDEDLLCNLNFFDKGYGWFRVCIDDGYTDEMIELLNWMYSKNKESTSEISDDEWSILIDSDSTFGDLRDLINVNGDIYFPDAFEFLKGINSNIDLVGGSVDECLKEVEILLEVLNKDYDLISKWVY